ncbi:ADP-ribosylglycohydrolase family protein [Pelagibacterium xiamenense]|uniref:ADP-ribosylglycohydrolase family protein n=1 Tax=Pelagibacterium xiamenense TaxID=2901140 RepID=UPI001E4C830C|nr:ADP-ribosylglycohydrolase family protein [Pelagibacterium xiamenense]MCD7058934.1 ADP-ribosylglycohydrolase family protein [Pelagibacterium xiamenense]
MTTTAKSDPSFSGRVRGLLHGVAFGDAMGAPVEKLSPGEIETLYGRVTSLDNKWHRTSRDPAAGKGRVRGNGIVTDDTLMTLCLMAVYNETGRHLDAWDMADGMVRQIAWVPRYVPELQRECALLERLFYPEKWIFQRHQLASCDPRQGGIGNMVNCGAAMYIAPVGVVNACDPQGAYDEAIAFAGGHQQSYGLEAAGVLAAAIAAAFVPGTSVAQIVATAHALAKDGTRKAIAEIAEAAEKLRDRGAGYPEIVETFHARIAKFSPLGDDLDHTAAKAGKATPNYQPSRFLSIEELPLALGFCITAEGDFRKAIEDGINSGRDTDSIGVMAGAILGAMHGDAVVDKAEAEQLDSVNKFDLAEEARRFARTAEAIFDADRRRRGAIDSHRAALAGAGVPAQ